MMNCSREMKTMKESAGNARTNSPDVSHAKFLKRLICRLLTPKKNKGLENSSIEIIQNQMLRKKWEKKGRISTVYETILKVLTWQ